jgi:molybdopterin-guanine dinucleotide biosynthesis protein A
MIAVVTTGERLGRREASPNGIIPPTLSSSNRWTAHQAQQSALADILVYAGLRDRYAIFGLHTIPDQNLAGLAGGEAVRSPLVRIATALNATSAPWNLILACDLFYLTAEWLDWLLARAIDSEAQIVMPRTSRGLEPLTAVYRSECAAPIVAALDRGVRKVTDAMAEFRTEQLLESNWQVHEPHGRALKNMNTLSDYEDAKQFLEREFSPLE